MPQQRPRFTRLYSIKCGPWTGVHTPGTLGWLCPCKDLCVVSLLQSSQLRRYINARCCAVRSLKLSTISRHRAVTQSYHVTQFVCHTCHSHIKQVTMSRSLYVIHVTLISMSHSYHTSDNVTQFVCHTCHTHITQVTMSRSLYVIHVTLISHK